MDCDAKPHLVVVLLVLGILRGGCTTSLTGDDDTTLTRVEFWEATQAVYCELWVTCNSPDDLAGPYWGDVDWQSAEDCIAWMHEYMSADEPARGCAFDPAEAARCLNAYEAVTCESFAAGITDLEDLDACDEVWSCQTP